MACACGGKKQNVDYEITFMHDKSKKIVGSLPEVRMELASSPKGGNYKAVPRK